MSRIFRNLRHRGAIGGLVVIAGLLFGCKERAAQEEASQPAEAGQIDLSKFERVYIERVEQSAELPDSGAVQIKVVGNLPNPAYTLIDFYVDVKDNTIEIIPLATVDRAKIVAQVIVPFERVVTVKGLKPGKYKVMVRGRGGEVTASASLR